MITPPIEQLEEMKPIEKVRKKREQKHDFGDGVGRVPASRHVNGKGWVAKTAVVENSVYVGPKCEVFNNAYVSGKVRLEGNAKIFGNATVSGNVKLQQQSQIFGRAVVRDEVLLQDNSRIGGNAHVIGNTRLRDTAIVTDGACVISSNLSGSCRVMGSALVTFGYIVGSVEVSANSIIVHSTLHGNVKVHGFGQVLNRSNVQNHNADSALIITDHAIITDESHIYWSIEFRSHAVVVRSRIHAYTTNNDANGPLRPIVGGNVILHQQRINSANDLVAAVDRISNPQLVARTQTAIPVVPGFPVRSADYLTTENRPRRVQRLQEAGT